jgi:hypothetical protein
MSNDFESIMKQMLDSINSNGCNDKSNNNSSRNTGQANNIKNNCVNLTPSQIIVIAGMLGGVLNVESVLVDRNQQINIVLSGSLKRKTDLDRMVEELGSKSFKEVISSIMGNLR